MLHWLFACALLASPAAAEIPDFRLLEKGKTPSYSTQGPRRQDLSGAVHVDGKAYLVYDGGPNSEHPEIRVCALRELPLRSEPLKRVVAQRDLEAITYHNGRFHVLSSQGQVDDDTEAFRLLAEFSLDPSGRYVRKERAVVVRDFLLEALRRLPDDRWFARVAVTFGVRGGLNTEGLAGVPGEQDTLIIGLRSPLWGPQFGDPAFGKGYRLDAGSAILAFVTRPYSDRPEVRLETLDLGGQGVRDIQWVEDLGAYWIIAGPVDRGPNFALWSWIPGSAPQKLSIPGFSGLCRPEAIMPIQGKSEVYFLSEEGGAFCESSDYTHIRVGWNASGKEPKP